MGSTRSRRASFNRQLDRNQKTGETSRPAESGDSRAVHERSFSFCHEPKLIWLHLCGHQWMTGCSLHPDNSEIQGY